MNDITQYPEFKKPNTTGCDGISLSNCCGEYIYEDTGICSGCQEHCDTQCADCENPCDCYETLEQ